jgi:hypothetical protein
MRAVPSGCKAAATHVARFTGRLRGLEMWGAAVAGWRGHARIDLPPSV